MNRTIEQILIFYRKNRESTEFLVQSPKSLKFFISSKTIKLKYPILYYILIVGSRNTSISQTYGLAAGIKASGSSIGDAADEKKSQDS